MRDRTSLFLPSSWHVGSNIEPSSTFVGLLEKDILSCSKTWEVTLSDNSM